ncbi:MAG TPA: outer membrane lipoprotein-sorting protein [Solimonas sp.]
MKWLVRMLGGAALLAIASGQASDAPQLPQLMECLRSNLPQRAVAMIGATTRTARGEATTREVQLAIRRGRPDLDATLWTLAPPELAGVSYLIQHREGTDQAYAWLPSIGEVRRIRGSGSEILGTTLRTDDLRQALTGFSGGAVSLGPAGQVHGWPTRRLVATAATDSAAGYDKVEVEITQPDCVLVEARLYREGRLRQTVRAQADSLRRQGRYRYASVFDVQVPDDNLRTELRILRLDPEPSLDSRWFDASRFFRRPASAAPTAARP